NSYSLGTRPSSSWPWSYSHSLAGAMRKPHILHFFLDFHPESFPDTLFQLNNQNAEIGGSSRAGVVDQVGVVAGYVNVATDHAFCSHLLQEVCRRDFPFPYGRDRHLRRDIRRQFGQQEILENTAGAFHRRGELLVANFQDVVGGAAEAARVGRVENQL